MIAQAQEGLESIFGWLLTASWQASVLALLVLLLQAVLRGRLNPRWRHALWLLVLLRLVLPALPESAWSLFRFAPSASPSLVASVTQPLFPSPVSSLPPTPASSPEPSAPGGHPFSLYSLLACAWLAGVLAFLVVTWQVNRRFSRQVRNSPKITDPALLHLFAAAKAELRIRRSIRLIENGQVQSPAITGLFLPTLLLPARVHDRFDATELRLIFLHELAHLKRGDVMIQALIALLQILHWFNPVLWYAFCRMRIDREPATDALVLSRAGEEEKERYGLMLIKLLEHFNQRHSLPTLVGIFEDQDHFKRRFSLIARFTRGAYGWSLPGAALIAVLGLGCLTKAKSATSAFTTDRLDRAHLEVTYIVSGQPFPNQRYGTISKGEADALLKNPKNEATGLINSSSPAGENTFKCKTLSGSDCTITVDWRAPLDAWRVVAVDYKTPGEESGSTGWPLNREQYALLRAANSGASGVLIGFTTRPFTPSKAAEATADINPASIKAVQLGLVVLEIPDDVYLANKPKIDEAMEKADIGLFNRLKGVSLLSTPSVTTQPSTRANIEIVREFSYPTSFENGRSMPDPSGKTMLSIPPTPLKFATKEIGVSAEITPSIDEGNSSNHGKIILNGKFTVTDFAGFTKSNLVGTGTPSFNTSESEFLEALSDHEMKGLWIPGEHVAQRNTYSAPERPQSSGPLVKKRFLLFVSASLVK
jgi:beta-lactamase regulating signal transducer with metallopeptidase domain